MKKGTWKDTIMALNIVGSICLTVFGVTYWLQKFCPCNSEIGYMFKHLRTPIVAIGIMLIPCLIVHIGMILLTWWEKRKLVSRLLMLLPWLFCFAGGIDYAMSEEERAEPELYVYVNTSDEYENYRREYQVLTKGGYQVVLEESVPMEEMTIYDFDPFNIECEVVNGNIQNTLLSTEVISSNGNKGETPALVEAFLKKIVKEIDHSIYGLRFFEVDGRLFAAVDLNVNWHDPTELYEYDVDTGEMKFIFEWQCTDVLGIALPE